MFTVNWKAEGLRLSSALAYFWLNIPLAKEVNSMKVWPAF